MRLRPFPESDGDLVASVRYTDSGNLDAFSRVRVSAPTTLFESHFQYDLDPLQFETVVSGTGAVTHDPTNSMATLSISGAGSAAIQSYRYIRYQPGKSQLILQTCNFRAAVPNAVKRYGLFDADDGFFVQQDGNGVLSVNRRSSTASGAISVTQSLWNLDTLDGNGPSGITLDITKTQIIVWDAQWLGVGRVRIAFDIDGVLVGAHQFLHANVMATPYVKRLTLPVRCEISTATTATASMDMVCSSVISEGGIEDVPGFQFCVPDAQVVADFSGGVPVRTHLLSIQPKATFNSIANRIQFILDSIDLTVQGTNPVGWELVVGQELSGTTTFSSVNSTYSGFEYNTAGTVSGSPAIVLDSGVISATANNKTAIDKKFFNLLALTLNAAGALRSGNMSRLSLVVRGYTGTSLCDGSFTWKEIK